MGLAALGHLAQSGRFQRGLYIQDAIEDQAASRVLGSIMP